MSGLVHSIKQGDTDPPCRAILKDANGQVAIIQNGDTVTWRMTPKVAGLRADISAAVFVNDGTAGDVEYRFVVGDTAVPGIYNAEFHVDYASGSKKTFPTDGYITVEVEHRAAST